LLTDTKIAAIKPPEKGQQEHPDHKVTGLRLRVGAGGAKTWTLRRRVRDKVLNRKLGTYPAMKLATARIAAEKLIEALERDGSTAGIDRTFRAAAEAWIEAKKRPDGIRRQLELHVLPEWGERKLGDIKRAEVRELIQGLEGEVLPNRVLATIKTIYGYAISQDWVETSPADRIEPPKKEKPRDRFLSMDEVARVWDASGLLGYPVGPWVRMLLLTAQRRSEVANMRWVDLDLDAATWTLPASETKAKRAHLVPLAPAAMEIIRAMPEVGDYVFSTTASGPINGFAKSKRKLDTWLESKGQGLDEPWRFHDLRTTASTHLARLGFLKEIRSRVLNHAVEGVTDRHYTPYDFAPQKRQALEAWAAEVDRAVTGERGDNVVSIGRGQSPY
jgi:integrase